jgi:mono/diheme cytochrome c family protein
MNLSYRPLLLGISVLAFSAAVLAGGNHYFAPVADPVVLEECGSCHMAYAPSMLPARSWKRMMGDLGKHFGDDASVDTQTAARIERYLVANAADTGGRQYAGKLLRGVAPDNAPLRITELPKWLREHREVSAREWRHKEVRGKANCVACHSEAARGYYDD